MVERWVANDAARSMREQIDCIWFQATIRFVRRHGQNLFSNLETQDGCESTPKRHVRICGSQSQRDFYLRSSYRLENNLERQMKLLYEKLLTMQDLIESMKPALLEQLRTHLRDLEDMVRQTLEPHAANNIDWDMRNIVRGELTWVWRHLAINCVSVNNVAQTDDVDFVFCWKTSFEE